MPVFKTFFITVKKQSTSLIIYFVIFISLSLLLSSNGKSQVETTFNDAKVKIAVIDRDQSTLSKNLYDYLDQTQNLVTIKDDKESMSDELFYRNVEYILIINEGFENNLKNGNFDNIVENIKVPQSITGKFLDNKINQYISTLNVYLTSGYSDTEAAQHTLDTSKITATVNMHQISKDTDENSAQYYYYTFIPYVLICMLTVGLGGILITFRNKDLNARIKCSALSNTKRNVFLILSSLALSFIFWFLFVAMSFVIYKDGMINTKGFLYIGNSFVFLIVAISLTYLISFLVSTPSTLNMASNMLGLGLSFLGGIFVPLQVMSSSVKAFSKFLPTYWYVNANQLVDKYSGTSEQIRQYLQYIGIEFVFAIALLALALGLSKYKKQK